jgi:cyclophilin family peptidyl-prolyl cis-trans isomerase
MISVAVFSVLLTVSAAAQEQKLPASPLDPAALGPKNAAFYEAHKPFAEKIQRLYALMQEYQTATPERQDAIQKEYEPLNIEADKSGKILINTAIDAFREAPYQNGDVLNFLVQMSIYEYQAENYERAFVIFEQLLRDDKPKELKTYLPYAAETAFNLMKLDKAEAWFKEAAESGAELTQELVRMQRAIPGMRKDWEAESAIREKEINSDLPRVLLKTNKGEIELVLFEDQAPNTVANFISLVEKEFYTEVPFHRVLPKFMAQGGDPTGTGGGGPDYMIDDECLPKPGMPVPRKHFRGSISMANAGPNTNGSQFFLTFVPTSFLNGRHTVFGRVDKGMEILSEIQRIDPDEKEIVVVPDKIIEAKVLSKRNHPYEPVKNGKRR